MSKSSSCNKDFILLLKHNGLSFQTCDGCRTDDKKYKDTHKDAKEQRKEYDIYYRELNKNMIKEKAKQYFENNKDKIYAKNKMNRITCECGCTPRLYQYPYG